MLGIAIVIMAAAAAAFIELPALMRKGWLKEAVLFSIILLAGVWTGIVAVKQIMLPSPLNFLHTIYKPINDWLSHFFVS